MVVWKGCHEWAVEKGAQAHVRVLMVLGLMGPSSLNHAWTCWSEGGRESPAMAGRRQLTMLAVSPRCPLTDRSALVCCCVAVCCSRAGSWAP
jgi:hypothetical protein